eukprot:c20310_g1_i1.p1 GENE.c20310_g1_i1~~c20310_g1_i1.p1  ORF type:complete len:311 (+),score=89.34 c20310_g1_i1:34-966(+)
MLCEIAVAGGNNFFLIWAVISLLAFISIMGSSSVLFYYYYWPTQVTYKKWAKKSNPDFPSPEKVRDEIIQMLKGMFVAAFCPAASLWLSNIKMSKAYCGVNEEHGYGYLVGSFFFIWIVSDFWEFFYHRLGHVYDSCWKNHKHHHVFFNPSPFAVIADEPVDQFFRSILLLLFPMIMPIDMDMMFIQYGVFFYVYGVYLHWGYELDYPDAHHPIINTAFQHYCHHAKAILNKPYHCGFFFKIWDQLSGGLYPNDKCFCVKCATKKGLRTPELYKKVKVPDYTCLLKLSFWTDRRTLTGATAKDTNLEVQT